MRRRSRAAIGQYEASLVLIVVSLSLVSVVYQGLKSEAKVGPRPLFVNQETRIAGSPNLVRLTVNSSSPTSLTSFSVDEASSTDGVLAFNGSGYSALKSLCATGVTTFFSVYASQPGTLQVTSSGQAWIAGAWSSAASVSPGWQEVMVSNAASCSVTLPGGQVLSGQWSPSSTLASAIPAAGTPSGIAFSFFIPSAGTHRVLITATGGLDSVAL